MILGTVIKEKETRLVMQLLSPSSCRGIEKREREREKKRGWWGGGGDTKTKTR